MELNIFKNKLSEHRARVLLYYVSFGVLMTLLFSGKTSITLEAIAVSPDEQYIACFERGDEHKILCFSSDASLAFDFNIPPDISAGGHCTLWFEDDMLCALFYRTDKIAYFALDGTILNIVADTTEESPSEFPSFFRRGYQYVFEGNEIDVVYDKGSFLGYWLLGAERYLAVTPKSGDRKVIYAWTATEGISEMIE